MAKKLTLLETLAKEEKQSVRILERNINKLDKTRLRLSDKQEKIEEKLHDLRDELKVCQVSLSRLTRTTKKGGGKEHGKYQNKIKRLAVRIKEQEEKAHLNYEELIRMRMTFLQYKEMLQAYNKQKKAWDKKIIHELRKVKYTKTMSWN